MAAWLGAIRGESVGVAWDAGAPMPVITQNSVGWSSNTHLWSPVGTLATYPPISLPRINTHTDKHSNTQSALSCISFHFLLFCCFSFSLITLNQIHTLIFHHSLSKYKYRYIHISSPNYENYPIFKYMFFHMTVFIFNPLYSVLNKSCKWKLVNIDNKYIKYINPVMNELW